MTKFEYFKNNVMARAQRLSLREINRSKSNSFIKQLLVLFLTIVMGVLVSVGVNAQSTSTKQNTSTTVKKYKAYKKKNRSRPNHYAAASPQETILTIPSAIQHSLIREIVAQNLQERKTSGPIELAPIFYRVDGNRLHVSDTNPILFALEFALQGRTVVIDDQPIIDNDYNTYNKYELVNEVIRMMTNLGAPRERIRTGEIQVTGSITGKSDDLFVRVAAL